jgi:signal transduction histidine kinase
MTWKMLYGRAGRKLETDVRAEVTVRASPGALGQVIDVLLENALTHGRGRVRVTVSDDDRRAVIAVEDEGPGIAPDLEPRLFERGSSEAGGTGVGLHLAQVLAGAEGGQLLLARASPPRFEIRLPHRPAAAPAGDDGVAAATARPG